MDASDTEMIAKVRAAIMDRAVWFALLYDGFKEVLPEEEVERVARKAIFEYGKMKAKSDPVPFTHVDWVKRHEKKGSALVFDSDIECQQCYSVQQMKYCPLVAAWKDMGFSKDYLAKFCDIAMEGDRGRAAAHGVSMTLEKSIGKGDSECRLVIHEE